MREYTPPRATLAVTLVVAAAALAGCSSTAYEPFTAENAGEVEDEGLVKGIMTGIGAIDPREKPIEYRPRAALVVPPKKDLRQPENIDAALADKQFPRNPEDQSIDRPKGDTSGFLTLADQQKFSNLPVARQARPVQDPAEASKPLSPDKLASPPASEVAISEQARRKKTLLDPPKEYATPSPNAPFEEEQKKESWTKPGWWPF